MVFINSDLSKDSYSKDTAVVAIRNTGKYLGLLLIESIFGLVVALSNIILIIILIIGWRQLMKNKFYIVLANLIVCTSLKSFVEFGFILPYYVLQSDGEKRLHGYFNSAYELLIFNISVFADYGVLFFSVLIAVNRFIAVSRSPEESRSTVRCPGLKTAASCVLVWACSAIIPVLFYFLDCQFAYNDKLKIYRNKCSYITEDSIEMVLLNCLVYLSYVCAGIVLLLYLLILQSLRRQQKALMGRKSSLPRAQVQLLRQSVVVFGLYAASIFCVFAMSFVSSSDLGAFEIAYVENLLNLSIAAAYPICFLVMSGEMKSILVKKFVLRSTGVSSVRLSSNNNQIARNEITP